MIQALIFDCFGVLYVDPKEHLLANELGKHPEVAQAVRDIYRQSDYGFITQEEVIRQVSEIADLDRSFVARTIQDRKILNHALLDFAETLRPTLKIGLLSNVGHGILDRYFTAESQARYFDAVLESNSVGMIKPYPEIYRLMAERLGVPPGDCAFVDDSEDNCAGADAAGMHPVLYRSNRQVIAELQKLLA